MTQLEVQFVDLEPMHVIVATGYGVDPEAQAWGSILDFARDEQLDPWDTTHRFFGFNNPDPDPSDSAYGYEQWMTVADDIAAEPPLQTRNVPGGHYATIRIHGLDTIGESWESLADWCESSGHRIDRSREVCLEELLTPLDEPPAEWDMNLYLAITD